jgi:hypothetical protein
MPLLAHSYVSDETDSGRAGAAVAAAMNEAFGAAEGRQGAPLVAVIVYATVNHDQAALLKAVRAGLGPERGVLVVGCSAQGVAGNGVILEGGFGVGAMGLGGAELQAAVSSEHEIQTEGAAKGRALAQQVVKQLGAPPDLMMLLYDPLCGADADLLVKGVLEVVSCPLVGGAASQPSGPVARTYQYCGEQAFVHGAVALGLRGPFGNEVAVAPGTVPTGIVMTLTRADGNRLLELDGRPALDVWRETIGYSPDEPLNQDHTAALALGIERTVLDQGAEATVYLMRAVFGLDTRTKAIVVQTAIPEGSKIRFHHRTVEVVREGTAAMGRLVAARLAAKGRRPWAVLCFECGARTAPFLGPGQTLEENRALQQAVAPGAPWLGLIAWAEIVPAGREALVHNYSYPLVVLTQ